VLFHDNLVLDKTVQIPSSCGSKLFVFNKHWDFAQSVLFELHDVSVENLYILMQSYLWNKNLRVTGVYTFYSRDGAKKILSYNNIALVKKMNFLYFFEWWDNVSLYDKQYLNETDLYGFVFKFSPTSFNAYTAGVLQPYQALRPKYPWDQKLTQVVLMFK